MSTKKSISNAVCDKKVGFLQLDVWSIGQEGRVSRDSPKEGTCFFFPDLYSFRVLRYFSVTHWSCTTLQNEELLALWLQDVAFSTVVRSL